MPISCMAEIVSDWGGFEKFIAELHATGEVSVERDVILKGRSGVSRQIDVLVRHRQGFYDHLILVECKHLKRPVSRLAVDAMTTAVHDLGAARGVIFSRAGFQKGAIKQARHENIDLFRVRDAKLTTKGVRYISCASQLISFCLLSVSGVFQDRENEVVEEWGVEHLITEDGGKSGITVDSGVSAFTDAQFESEIIDASRRLHESRLSEINPLYNGWVSYKGNIDCALKREVIVTDRKPPAALLRLRLSLAARFLQSTSMIDRFGNLAFILAVEDCVRSKITPVYRLVNDLKFMNIRSSALMAEPASIAPGEKIETCYIAVFLGWADPDLFRHLDTTNIVYSANIVRKEGLPGLR